VRILGEPGARGDAFALVDPGERADPAAAAFDLADEKVARRARAPGRDRQGTGPQSYGLELRIDRRIAIKRRFERRRRPELAIFGLGQQLREGGIGLVGAGADLGVISGCE